jgi:hypothetical protein
MDDVFGAKKMEGGTMRVKGLSSRSRPRYPLRLLFPGSRWIDPTRDSFFRNGRFAVANRGARSGLTNGPCLAIARRVTFMEPKQDPQSSPTPRQDPPIGGPETLRGITWGLEFGLTIAVFVGIGYFADQKLGTGPWLLVLSLFLGFGGALYSLVRKADRTSTPRPSKAGASKGTSPDSGVKRP